MQQEVIQIKENELELLEPNKRYACEDCKNKYTHIEKCKDGKQRCKRCKKKLVTNKFYNPNWKNKIFIGNYNMNDVERKLLIKKYLGKGLDYGQAVRKVNYDIKCMQSNRCRKHFEEKQSEQNLNIKKESNKEMKNKLLEGLGQR